MAIFTNCESATRRDCLRLGLGALIGGGLVDALRLRGAGGDRRRPADELHPDLDGRRAEPLRDLRPQAGRARARSAGKFDADRDQGPRHPVLRAHEAAGGDRRQARDRPLDPPRPGEPRGGQSLHDDRRPDRGSRSAAGRSSASTRAWARSRRTSAGARAACRLISRCPSMSRSGGPNFLGAKYAPFVVPDDPNSTSFRVRDVAPPARPEPTNASRSSPRPPRRRRPLPAIRRQGRGRPGRGPRRLLRAGLRPDVVAARPSGRSTSADEPDKVRDAYGRNAFGQRCLLARRLVEAGVPFVTLNEGGWDHHVRHLRRPTTSGCPPSSRRSPR